MPTLPKYPGWLGAFRHGMMSMVFLLFVKVDSVMMLTTSQTTTTGMLSVLANTSVSVADVSLSHS